MYRKVIAAFSLLYGSEVFLVMKDIWGMDNQQVIDNVQWMAKAIINQANRESSQEEYAE
jgi:alpha-ketoglutarate-dependent taurine dioxygenase